MPIVNGATLGTGATAAGDVPDVGLQEEASSGDGYGSGSGGGEIGGGGGWTPRVGHKCMAKWLDEEGEDGVWYPGTARVVDEEAQSCSVWFDDEILQEDLPWRLCKPFALYE